MMKWHERNDYLKMLREAECLTWRTSRLLCVAVCRAVWGHIEMGILRSAVTTGEAFADGLVPKEYIQCALNACQRSDREEFVGQGQLAINCVFPDGFSQHSPCFVLAVNIGWLCKEEAADIVRCVVPEPRSPLPFLPFMKEAMEIAKVVYYRRNEDYTLDSTGLLAIADMVEEEVGGNVITEHLRENKPRYRGDWALDLVMKNR